MNSAHEIVLNVLLGSSSINKIVLLELRTVSGKFSSIFNFL
ncbi:unnamed protein product [Acanthoscelides obtectus]|uniref:Uncharacterized protein n=1 Tax=Acanthoscelides obtectus TaxID=200917 RepID=A0A9P0NWN1_ACAOB|nr:unnamed protein product [Acanthoscelides obtectus]CAK1654366.1 hypothetical protein AOBTE_LOCUS18545 [Acanthoscelides obtectus]